MSRNTVVYHVISILYRWVEGASHKGRDEILVTNQNFQRRNNTVVIQCNNYQEEYTRQRPETLGSSDERRGDTLGCRDDSDNSEGEVKVIRNGSVKRCRSDVETKIWDMEQQDREKDRGQSFFYKPNLL